MEEIKNNYLISINVDETMKKAIDIIKSDVEDKIYEKMDWSLFVSTALLMFSKMMDNDNKPMEFEDFLRTHTFNKNKRDA